MKNIKLKIFTLLCIILLQTPAFSGSTFDVSASANTSTDIEATSTDPATLGYQAKTINALVGTQSLLDALNKIFVRGTGSEGQSDLDKKIDMYVSKFYDWYTTTVTKKTDGSANNEDVQNTRFEADYIEIESAQSAVSDGLKNLLTNELAYYNQAKPLTKKDDLTDLINLSVDRPGYSPPVETDDDSQPNSVKILGFEKAASLTEETPSKDTPPTFPNALNINSLIGPDVYTQTTKEKKDTSKAENKAKKDAQLYMAYIFQLTPPPKMFVIPIPDGSSDITIQLPYTSSANDEQNLMKKVKAEDYGKLQTYLTENNLYQEYKEKSRVLLALQTLYHNNFLNAYQERLANTSDTDSDSLSLSLVEREKQMAMEGLEMKYEDLKKKTMADVNLETLYTLNKIVYFLHKLHQDNERIQLTSTITAMQAQNQDTQNFNTKYIGPLKKLFTNECWKENVTCDNNFNVAKTN
jgi:hypothetical protein